jgi:uncharacterized protein (TIGR03435 family)
MSRRIAFVALAVLAGGLLTSPRSQAQSSAPRRSFEVASIKLNAGCKSANERHGGSSPGRLTLPCVTLRNLISAAYGGFSDGNLSPKRTQVVEGPAWLDSDLYDISAKADGNASFDQMAGPMMQVLLEDRFRLKVRREPRDTAVYILTVAKNGSKLQASTKTSCTPMNLAASSRPSFKPGEPGPKICGAGMQRGGIGGGVITDWYGVTMAEFAGRMLSSVVDRPVIDRTGLPGQFDVHLEFVREDPNPGSARLNGVDSPGLPAAPDQTAGPSIFSAVQVQLGLKLSPARASVDVIVVDHVERPAGN